MAYWGSSVLLIILWPCSLALVIQQLRHHQSDSCPLSSFCALSFRSRRPIHPRAKVDDDSSPLSPSIADFNHVPCRSFSARGWRGSMRGHWADARGGRALSSEGTLLRRPLVPVRGPPAAAATCCVRGAQNPHRERTGARARTRRPSPLMGAPGERERERGKKSGHVGKNQLFPSHSREGSRAVRTSRSGNYQKKIEPNFGHVSLSSSS